MDHFSGAPHGERPRGQPEGCPAGACDGAPRHPAGGQETCLFEGRVTDLAGTPIEGARIEGARIDVCCDSEDGFHDVQQPDLQPRHNNRGVFTTGPDGRYWFRGIKPVSCPIPGDGPVGQLLGQLGRHPYRPAHMHFIVGAEGDDTVTIHTFAEGDEYLTSDAVFGVKASLIARFEPVAGGETRWRSEYDFVQN